MSEITEEYICGSKEHPIFLEILVSRYTDISHLNYFKDIENIFKGSRGKKLIPQKNTSFNKRNRKSF